MKIHYLDLPVFVDASSIVARYSPQTGVAVNGVLKDYRAAPRHAPLAREPSRPDAGRWRAWTWHSAGRPC